MKMKTLKCHLPTYRLLCDGDVERLHRASMRILSELGIAFEDEEARAILRSHGAKIDRHLVYFDAGLVQKYVSQAPSQFTQLARNPSNNVVIGADRMVLAPVHGPPFLLDHDTGRRRGTLDDLEKFVKLAYLSPYVHHSGGILVEPDDQPVETRHLDVLLAHIRYSDKAFMGSVASAQAAADSVAMAEILFGPDAIRNNPALLSLINPTSPRCYDKDMLASIKVYARARQGLVITPAILAGITGPVTVASSLVQQNAEALAGIALAQMIEPGTPVVYGSALTTVDLQSGTPVFGSPESLLALFASAQLARRYDLPFRAGGALASSKLPDAQAAYESAMLLLSSAIAGTNFVLHAAGCLDNGLVSSYEKFVLDSEILGMLHKLADGLDVSDETLAPETIGRVPPGGHHLATEHTLSHFRDAFYRAELFDYSPREIWKQTGAKNARSRASRQVRRLLANYVAPHFDPVAEKRLTDYVQSRKAELLSS